MSDIIKIGIVDDHTMFRKSLRMLINLFDNCTVVLDADNGEQMIRGLDDDHMPDIILMDITMPVMDGYASTSWLRDNYPLIKVIALSTMDADTAVIKMIRNGAKGYILKDADPEELKLAFSEIIRRGYFYNEHITKRVITAVNELTDSKNDLNLFVKLSEREITFLKLSCSELTYKEIADKICVSVRTVEGYRDNLCEKLNLKSRVGLAMYAIKNQIATL